MMEEMGMREEEEEEWKLPPARELVDKTAELGAGMGGWDRMGWDGLLGGREGSERVTYQAARDRDIMRHAPASRLS